MGNWIWKKYFNELKKILPYKFKTMMYMWKLMKQMKILHCTLNIFIVIGLDRG